MKELFLLGAGASVKAGIPKAVDMTKQMLDSFKDDQMVTRENKILRFVTGGLLFQQGQKGDNPFDGVNIEDVFNAVEILGDRQNSDLGAFIGSWHPRLSELEGGQISGMTGKELLDSISQSLGLSSNNSAFAPRHFQQNFSKAIREFLVGSEGELFNRTNEAMIKKLVEMVWINEISKIEYLTPLIQYAKTTKSPIVTLNYDNTIELAGQASGVDINTGFEAWSKTGEFNFEEFQVKLIKLHGSIDWELVDERPDREKPLPFQSIQKVDPNSKNIKIYRPAVIFGGKNKLTVQEPFLSLLITFKHYLYDAEKLTVMGYSFRDEHINEFIANWLNGNVRRRIRIIDIAINKQNHFIRSLGWIENKSRVKFLDNTRIESFVSEIDNDW